MAGTFQPLGKQFPIVNDDGTPTEYFIRWAQERQIDIGEGITGGEAQQLIDDWAAGRSINTGMGLAGGGNLSADRTVVLDADLDDLNDVDTVSTPPTNGQVLTYNSTSSLWVPQTPSGGGGSAKWKILNQTGAEITTGPSVTVTTPLAVVDFINLAQYSELLLIGSAVTGSVSSFRGVLASVDNGVSFFNASGNYIRFGANGSASNAIQFDTTSTSSSAAVSFWLNILNSNTPGVGKDSSASSGLNTRFVASLNPINALRYIHSSGGNVTGGTLTLLGR